MHRLPVVAVACLVLAVAVDMAGCQRPAPPTTGRAAPGAAPTTTASAPALPPVPAVFVAYRCGDGRLLRVRYGDGHAEVRWPDGRAVSLPRAESASKGDGDVYVGATVSVQRDGKHLQLHEGQATALACEQHAP